MNPLLYRKKKSLSFHVSPKKKENSLFPLITHVHHQYPPFLLEITQTKVFFSSYFCFINPTQHTIMC